jgi:hypothetical protein
LRINLGEGEAKRFELFEPGGRVFKAPGTSLRLIKNVLDKGKGIWATAVNMLETEGNHEL